MDKEKGGGINTLKIKENAGTWTLMEPGPMAEKLRDFALNNYRQANHIIFGHGKGHDLLTDDPMTNPVYDTFLDGKFLDT